MSAMLRHPASLVPLATHDPALMALVERPVDAAFIKHIADEIPLIVQGAVIAPARLPPGRTPPSPPPREPERAASQPPIPTLQQFITQLVERSNIQLPTLLCTMVYLYRLKARLPTVARRLLCAHHRMFLAAVIVAAKYLNDSSLKNKYWVRYGGLFSQSDVNLMERQLLLLLDHDLRIDEPELLDYALPFFATVDWADFCLPADAFVKTHEIRKEEERYARAVLRRARLRTTKKLTGAGARCIMKLDLHHATSTADQESPQTALLPGSPPGSPHTSPSVAPSAVLDQPSHVGFNHTPSFINVRAVRPCGSPLSFLSWDDVPLADEQGTVSSGPSSLQSSSTVVSPESSDNHLSTAPTSCPPSSLVPPNSRPGTSERGIEFLSVSDNDHFEIIDTGQSITNPSCEQLQDDLPALYLDPRRPVSPGSPMRRPTLVADTRATISPASSTSTAQSRSPFHHWGLHHGPSSVRPRFDRAIKYRHSFGATGAHVGEKLTSPRPGGQRKSMPFLRYLFMGSASIKAENAPVGSPSSPSTPSATEYLNSPPKRREPKNTAHMNTQVPTPARPSSKPLLGPTVSTARSMSTVGLSPSRTLATRVSNREDLGNQLQSQTRQTATKISGSSGAVAACGSSSQGRFRQPAKVPVRYTNSTVSEQEQARHQQCPDQVGNGYSLLPFSPARALRRVTAFSLKRMSGGHA